jgi:hypothetical protein
MNWPIKRKLEYVDRIPPPRLNNEEFDRMRHLLTKARNYMPGLTKDEAEELIALIGQAKDLRQG